LKLRILDNSIRLRLTRTEVETLAAEGLVRGRTHFAGRNSFAYVLESSPATVQPEAHFSNNVLTVRAPKLDIHNWVNSDKVSIRSEQLLDDGENLRILIEKDFACLAPREGEDDSDMYPHPNAESDSC
jgi:hypothetical protein